MSGGNSPHEYALGNLLRNMQRAGSGSPDTAIRFYLAVIDSPQGNRFGTSDTNSGQPFHATIGDAIMRHFASGRPEGIDPALLPWLAAESVSEDLLDDALAAVACHALHHGRKLNFEKIREIARSKKLSEKTRRYASAVSLLINPADSETPEASYEGFANLLADPALRGEARIQLAITAGSRIRGTLSHPGIAEEIADIFSAHCATERSAVDGPGIALVEAISREEGKTGSFPHLERINRSFWENANQPKAGTHQEIPARSVEALFQTAVFLSDEQTANRLFPLLQGSMTGKPPAILSMIQAGRFDFATALFPDGESPFQSDSIRIRRTPELERQLAAFRESGAPPAGLLRFELLLLNLRDADNKNPTPEAIAKRKDALIPFYEKNPPEGPFAKLEILAALATSTNPQDTRFSDEVVSVAATLDPARILNDWSDNSRHSASAPQRWDLLCKSASGRLVAGDGSVASHFVTRSRKTPRTLAIEAVAVWGRLIAVFSSMCIRPPALQFRESKPLASRN